MPHAYDTGPEQEVAQFRLARAIGADGVQTNQPDAIIAAAGQPAPSRLLSADGEICLVNAEIGLGFPTKEIELREGRRSVTLTAGLGGCADLPGPRWNGATAEFAGDGSVRPARARVRPLSTVPENSRRVALAGYASGVASRSSPHRRGPSRLAKAAARSIRPWLPRSTVRRRRRS